MNRKVFRGWNPPTAEAGIFGQSADNVLVAGHRGMAALFPENTLSSFRAAHGAGVDMIEMDLRFAKDGKLAVIHDATVDRTTDGAGEVRDFTLKELKALDAGAKFAGGKFSGEKILSFDEFLEFARPTNLFLNVEIKECERAAVDMAVAALRAAGLDGRYVIASFHAQMTEYADCAHNVPTQGFPARYAKGAGENTCRRLYAVGVPIKGLDLPDCKKPEFDALGIDYWTWCPDAEEDVARSVAAGATLMTCNNPIPALEWLRARNKHP